MASIDQVIARWLETIDGRRDRYGRPLRQLSGANVWADGNAIYSYGRHFPLAEFYRRPRSSLFLLNGDRVSVSTTNHQSAVRAHVEGYAPRIGAEVLIVPFSALDAAGIIRETIRPLEVRPDRWTERREPVPDDVTLDDVASAHETDEIAPGVTVYRWNGSDGHTYSRRVWDGRDEDWTYRGDGRDVERGDDGRWYTIILEHLLGDSVFVATSRETVTRRREWTVADVVRTARIACETGRSVIGVLDGIDIDRPIAERVEIERRYRYISAFDSNERRPLYFLARLPRSSRARTVDDAIMDLAPPAVHAAILAGREVLRQGDIFAIATDLTDADIGRIARERARLTQWTQSARPQRGEIGYRPRPTAETLRRYRAYRRRLWRELFHAEPDTLPTTDPGARRRYRELRARHAAELAALAAEYRSRLFRGEWRTLRAIRERHDYLRRRGGRDSWGYDRVAAARDLYRRAGRGRALELWRIATDRARLRYGLDHRYTERERERIRRVLAVHGTAHSATEVVRAAGGAVYVRGIMRQVPSLEPGRGRAVDHAPLRLGDGRRWYLALRNTVPRARV